MCGIAGIVDPGLTREPIRPIVRRMTNTLIHRGPDEDGFFVADTVGLGMRRLSIIDLAGGRQPKESEDGGVQVVFNGEIYNYPDLRRELEQKGHVFRSRSDTEVIAHLYEDRSVQAFADLRGMFGIALWDRSAKRLVLARDRVGKKPLYYARSGDSFLFGSEIKAILAADPSLAEPDDESLVSFLQFSFVPEPRTMYRHIRKVPAGHWLVYEGGEVTIAPYWRLELPDDDAPPPRTAQMVEQLDALLEEAVRIRLMSEVPLGIFLSGGLDSSTIVAYAHRAGLRPIKTFAIGFDRRGWDESQDAAVVARHFGTEHHVLMLRGEDMARSLPDTVETLVRHYDEPPGDSSALPTYHVSKLAREHVTVILSGDGGDELFAGYTLYQGLRFARNWKRVPRWLGRGHIPGIAQECARWLPRQGRYRALRVAKVLRDSELPFNTMYFTKGPAFRPGGLRELLHPDVADRLVPHDHPFLAEDLRAVMRSNAPDVSKAAYLDLRLGLTDGILVKVDRMSMAHSLEVRSPLLDGRLVDFATRLPVGMKLRGWQTKAILRDTVRHQLPASTLRKRKQGFLAPLREWLRDGLHEMVGDLLEAPGGGLPPELFDHAAVATLLSQHRAGQADHSTKIWLLLTYAMWRDLYVRRTAASPLLRRAI